MARKGREKYALISVSDKKGIVEFAKLLFTLDYQIISTGGTAKILSQNKIPVIPIEKVTGNPESFNGRMKTISFQIESGILFDRKNKKHIAEAKKLGIKSIDIVVSNFYDFEKKKTIKNIDVGGPTMVRAAAKNYKNVLVVSDPKDYILASQELERGFPSEKLRKHFSAKAFAHLSYYDSQISKFLNTELFPEKLTIGGKKIADLRYGENPHQKASFYSTHNSSVTNLKKLWGRDLSLTNLTDINAGLESVSQFENPCSAVIKHNTPCGIALGKTSSEALKRAIEADPTSAFGGTVVINSKFDINCAKVIEKFKNLKKANMDIIAAPKFDKKSIDLLIKVRKSIGIYQTGKIKPNKNLNIKWVDGGFVIQTVDSLGQSGIKDWRIVTNNKPSKKQLEQAETAWKFISRVKSNSIIIVDKNLPMTRGIGSGQTSRIKSAEIALSQAKNFSKGAILASDSFFPFDDCVRLAAKYKVGAIIQQGGSLNDKASIEAANKAGIPMVFTGKRSFWH